MKKHSVKRQLLALIMAIILLSLAACSNSSAPSSSTTPSSQAESTPPPSSQSEQTSTPSSSSESAPSTMSDEQVFATFQSLAEKGKSIYFWYTGDPYDGNENGLEIEIEPESEGEQYRKVEKFSTVDEMKTATEEVFTQEFCEAVFYEHAFNGDTPMYKEIDGELYRDTEQGGTGWPWEFTDECYIPYQDTELIVIEAKTLLLGDEIEWNNFLLRKIDGAWKLDSLYEMNPHMEYSSAFPVQREKELRGAVSSWLCTQNWTDINQLGANELLNLYLYYYCEGQELEYDYEKGYPVSSADLIEALSVYVKDIDPENLKDANELNGDNATYDEAT